MKIGATGFFLIAFLVLALQANAQSTSPCATELIQSWPPCCFALAALPQSLTLPLNLIGVSLLALLVSIDVVAIGYIIGRIIPSSGVKNWISDEFLEIAKSAMLIVGIFALLTFMGNIASLLAPPLPTAGVGSAFTASGYNTYSSNIYGLAYGSCAYLGNLQNNLYDTYGYLLGISAGLGFLESLSFGLYAPLPIPPLPWPPPAWLESGFSYNPYANQMFEGKVTTDTYESVVNDVLNMVAFPISLIIIMQENLIIPLIVLGLTVLIPLGLVLRALPFVRGIGGTMIAIGIGVSIVYPTLLVFLNWPVTNALSFGSYQTTHQANCGSDPITCLTVGNLNAAGGLDASAIGDSIGGAFVDFQAFPVVNGILFYSFFLLLQFMLFVADIAIAFPLVDSIARTLGGSISVSLAGKLRLT